MKATCLVCQNEYEVVFADKHLVVGAQDGGYAGSCPQCREDAAVGRAVREMPEQYMIHHGENDFFCYSDCSKKQGKGKTPLEALRAAGLVKE